MMQVANAYVVNKQLLMLIMFMFRPDATVLLHDSISNIPCIRLLLVVISSNSYQTEMQGKLYLIQFCNLAPTNTLPTQVALVGM